MENKKVSKGSQRSDLTGETLKIFWNHAQVYWALVVLCVVSMLVVITCELALPLIYKQFFDQLAIDPIHKTDRATLEEIYRTVFIIASVMVISWFSWRVNMFAAIKMESQVIKDLTDSCFTYLQNNSHRFFTDNFAGALVKRVNRFAVAFEVIADQFILELGPTALRVVLIVGILFWRNTTLGLIFLVWTVTFVIFNFFFAKWKLKFDLARAELDTKVTARLSDTITNALNLKVFAGIDREVAQFKSLTDKHRNARYKSWKLAWLYEGIQGLSVRTLEVLMLVMAVGFWLAGDLTIGDFVLLRSYLSSLTEQIRMIGKMVQKSYEVMADANEMTEVFLKPHEIIDSPNAKALVTSAGVVEFQNVKFSYLDGTKLVLQNLNLKTRKGERVGIVGPSGGGKSTILKLLVRLYDLNDGSILVDGQNIAGVTQASLRRNIAYVPQDPILFHRSLMENIRYSRPEATDEEVIQSSRLAHCHEFISGFPAGYKTLVGERGVKLSGGERQRVAIARAILMNAPILVLDEATSSLDSESETFIQDSLSKLILGRTVIAVAHRFSTIRKMDRIIVVKDGCIIEEGNHDLLLKIENGIYRRLWNLQSTAD